MEERRREAHVLQWHPAFYAGIQIELEGETENLFSRASISWEQSPRKLMY